MTLEGSFMGLGRWGKPGEPGVKEKDADGNYTGREWYPSWIEVYYAGVGAVRYSLDHSVCNGLDPMFVDSLRFGQLVELTVEPKLHERAGRPVKHTVVGVRLIDQLSIDDLNGSGLREQDASLASAEPLAA